MKGKRGERERACACLCVGVLVCAVFVVTCVACACVCVQGWVKIVQPTDIMYVLADVKKNSFTKAPQCEKSSHVKNLLGHITHNTNADQTREKHIQNKAQQFHNTPPTQAKQF